MFVPVDVSFRFEGSRADLQSAFPASPSLQESTRGKLPGIKNLRFPGDVSFGFEGSRADSQSAFPGSPNLQESTRERIP